MSTIEELKRMKFCHFLYKNLDVMVVSESDLDEIYNVVLESLQKHGLLFEMG